jgi:hypothetical protein
MTSSSNDTRSTVIYAAEIRTITASASGGSAGDKWVFTLEPNGGDRASGSHANVKVTNEYDETSLTFELQDLPAIIDALSMMRAILERMAS